MKDIEQAITDELAKQKKQPDQVTSLNLDSKCKSTHVKGLDAFVNLQSLSLCNVGLTSLEGFPKLPKLVRLTLSDNRNLTGGLQHLVDAGLTSLRTLELANCRIGKLEELEPLKSLKSLRSLDLDQCPVAKASDFAAKVFTMLDELKYLDSVDKEGRERDGDEEEDDAEDDDAGEEEYDPNAGGEGEEEYEDEEGGEFEEGEKEYAVLAGAEPVGEDEEDDYVEEGEAEDDDDEEGEAEEAAAEAAGGGGTKRKRAEEGDEEGEEDE